jgi:hypothetical protein
MRGSMPAFIKPAAAGVLGVLIFAKDKKDYPGI